MTDTALILHVKGTDQTTSLPRRVVRAGIAQGQITRSQLIWSVADNAWKQVRELPDLLPSQKLAPAPSPRTVSLPAPRAVTARPVIMPGKAPEVAVPKIRVQGPPRIKIEPQAVPRIQETQPVPVPIPTISRASAKASDEDQGFAVVKWISVATVTLVCLLVGANYLLVDEPLNSQLKVTPYGHVFVFAHLGAFVQPRDLVIHTMKSPAVPPAKVADFLFNLAHGTPASPVTSGPFERICLSRGWFIHYSMSGFAWNELGRMTHQSDAERKTFLLDELEDASGNPLLDASGSPKGAAHPVDRRKVWQEVAAYFSHP